MRLLLQHLAFVLFFACAVNDPDAEVALAETSIPLLTIDTISVDTIPTADTIRTISLIGVGDMMLGTNYPSNYLPRNGGKDLLSDVDDILKSADVTFGNLEGTILDSGGTPKRCKDPSVCYAFRSPESYGQHFADAGFDILSLANNHSGDFGPVGRKKTKSILDGLGIRYAGLAGTDESVVFEQDGIRYGFAAFAPNSGTVDVRNLPRAKQIVADLAAKSDIVIVSFHGGAEGAKNQRVTKKTETYYGENRGNVHAFAHAVVDAGADVVFGHGPHVTRAAELYKDRFIIYSLGNFCTYGRFNLRDVAGIAPLVKLEVTPEGKFVSGEAISVYQQKTHGPKIDAQHRAAKKLKELTALDFPDTDLVISEEGKLSKK
jgi:hypothetical protein